MTRRKIHHSLASIASVLTLGLAVAGCTGSKVDPTPAEVHDDVYVTGASNNRIVLDADTAYIVNSLDNTLDAVDLSTCGEAQGSCQRVDQHSFPAGTNPYDAVLVDGSLWVTGLSSNELYGLELPGFSETVLDSSGTIAFETPLAVGAAQGKIFVSNSPGFGSAPGYVTVVVGGVLTTNVPATQLAPSFITDLPNSSQLAVTNSGALDFSTGSAVVTSAGGIDLLDPFGETVMENIPLGLTYPGPTAASEDGAYLFVTSGVTGDLMRVEISSGTIETVEVTPEATFLSHVLVDGDLVYVLSFNEDRVYRLDADTLEPVDFVLEEGSAPFLSLGPGGTSAKGPIHAAIWDDGSRKRLLVLLTLSNSMTLVDL